MEWFCTYREKEQAPLNMVFPKEGPVLWVDTLAIPKTSKNPDGAHKLINYLLGAKAAEKLTLAIGYPTANLEAKKRFQKKSLKIHLFIQQLKFFKKATGKMM